MFINGVSVVVARVGGIPYGMSIAWATQVEAERLIVSLPRDSASTEKVRAAGCFTVNILAASQRALALRFGSAGEAGDDLAGSKFTGSKFAGSRFEGVDYAVKGEAVVLTGCHRAIFCDLESAQEIGKQLVVVGLLRRSDLASGSDPPLIYKKSDYFSE